ncbi:MAG: protein kinase domain-containing protein, partial [Gaiellaceae bacterium]
KLEHKRCLRAYACGRDGENVYIAYEYVPGRTFREAMRSGELADADAVEAAAQVLDGLAHAHDKGIVHRDVKPANVLLADGDVISVRLLDFGLARFEDSETLTSAGDVPGTLAYIAPERLHGEPANAAGDIWSVGVLLYEALAGRHPFWRSSLAETADAIAAGAPPLAELRPDLPKPLLAAIDRALDLDPAKRPRAGRLARLLRSTQRTRSGAAASLSLLERRVIPSALAGAYAGAAAALLPFYPVGAAPVLGLIAAALTFFRARLGVALALAVPVLPLGNVALALALVYAALAFAWLVLHTREPERAVLVGLGPLLGPLAALGLLPLLFRNGRSASLRALDAGVAVVLATIVAAVHRSPIGLGIPGSRDPVAAAEALGRALPHPTLALALVVAVAAGTLPLAERRGRWGLAFWGGALLLAALLPVAPVPIVLACWLTVGTLAARTYTGLPR